MREMRLCFPPSIILLPIHRRTPRLRCVLIIFLILQECQVFAALAAAHAHWWWFSNLLLRCVSLDRRAGFCTYVLPHRVLLPPTTWFFSLMWFPLKFPLLSMGQLMDKRKGGGDLDSVSLGRGATASDWTKLNPTEHFAVTRREY